MTESTNRASETQNIANLRRMNSNRKRFLAIWPKVQQSNKNNATFLRKAGQQIEQQPAAQQRLCEMCPCQSADKHGTLELQRCLGEAWRALAKERGTRQLGIMQSVRRQVSNMQEAQVSRCEWFPVVPPWPDLGHRAKRPETHISRNLR